jgi:hypothetical protein
MQWLKCYGTEGNNWAPDMAVEHGEVELRVLCDRFLMSYNEVKHEFREYKESQGKLKPVKLRQLMNHVNTHGML